MKRTSMFSIPPWWISKRKPPTLSKKDISSQSAPLTKGLNERTLGLIRLFLSEHPEEIWSSEQISEQVHLSRITVRRYLNYLVETNELVSMIDYQTGGRPSIKYRYSGK